MAQFRIDVQLSADGDPLCCDVCDDNWPESGFSVIDRVAGNPAVAPACGYRVSALCRAWNSIECVSLAPRMWELYISASERNVHPGTGMICREIDQVIADEGRADVLVLLPTNDLVLDNRVQRTAASLAQAGRRVTVLARASSRVGCGFLSEAGYRVEFVGGAGRGTFLSRYCERVARYDASAVHANDMEALLAAGVAGCFEKAAVVYDSHEYWSARPVARWMESTERALIGRCHDVITVSDGIAARLASDFKELPPVTVIRNIPDLAGAKGVVAPDLRERIGIGQGERLAIFAGLITAESRGLETLFDALARVSGWHLVLVGDGPAVPELRNRVEELGISSRVHFEGFVSQEDLIGLIAQADVGICLIRNVNTSYYLALPNKLFEYVHAGVGVIGSNLPEISAFIAKHGVGSVVDPDSASSVASALKEWKAPPQACLEAAQSDADWDREKVRLLSIYDRCLGPGRGSWETPPARPRWPEEASEWTLLTSGLPPALESAAQHAFEKVITIPGVEELQAWLGSAERARILVLDEALIESTRSGHALRLAWASRGLELLAGDPIRCRTRPFGWAERSHRRLRAHHWKRARRRELERLVSRSGSPEPQGRRGIGGGGLP